MLLTVRAAISRSYPHVRRVVTHPAPWFTLSLVLASILVLSSLGWFTIRHFSRVHDEHEKRSALNDHIATLKKADVINDQDLPIGDPAREATPSGYNVTTKRKMSRSYDQLVAFDPNSDTIWPGAVLAGNSLALGVPTLVQLPRAPMALTLSNIAFTSPNAKLSTTVASPSNASAQDEVNKLLHQAPLGPTSAYVSTGVYAFHSMEHARLQVGASGSAIFASFEGDIDSEQQRRLNRCLATLTQRYYTVTCARAPTASGFFTPVDLDAAKAQIYDNPPAYVSSVSYGRVLLFFISSSHEESKLLAAARAAFDIGVYSGGVNVSQENQHILDESEIRVFALGGPSASAMKLITGGKLDGIKAYAAEGANFTAESAGVPIAYTVKYAHDGTPARVSFTTEYTVTTFEPVAIDSLDITLHTESDDKDQEETVKLDLYRGNELIGTSGPHGKGVVWKDQDKEGGPRTFNIKPTQKLEMGTSNLALVIEKSQDCGGGGGCGWHATVDVLGTLQNGRKFTLRTRDSIEYDGADHNLPFGPIATVAFGNGSPASHRFKLNAKYDAETEQSFARFRDESGRGLGPPYH